ncbi:hypothetical protein LRAMOSA10112 [Lichtheimia ramosa]|uniref:Uncharacterized protein n=1 Tax=Lichtheimia ramosa TaxID=688394 RepID=A0A077WM48_9FUNG|nr:hypothetical protein LRAMOSA10112 [Lichtheimia ramosa]
MSFSTYESRSTSMSDEGYHSDEKPSFSSCSTDHQDEPCPIVHDTHTIRISYTPITLALTSSIIILSLYSLTTLTWAHTFPPFFVMFHLSFHVMHLTAHMLQLPDLERLCVVYGTSLYWTGWLLGILVFSERLTLDPTISLFWLLMIERRNAWGIILWEFVSRLEEQGGYQLLAYRIWSLMGAGSAWGLLYIALARMDGFALLYLLKPTSVAKLLLVSTMAGISMICYWSFWTFQYRGVIWRRDLRNGVVVWYSDGVARAGNVE